MELPTERLVNKGSLVKLELKNGGTTRPLPLLPIDKQPTDRSGPFRVIVRRLLNPKAASVSRPAYPRLALPGVRSCRCGLHDRPTSPSRIACPRIAPAITSFLQPRKPRFFSDAASIPVASVGPGQDKFAGIRPRCAKFCATSKNSIFWQQNLFISSRCRPVKRDQAFKAGVRMAKARKMVRRAWSKDDIRTMKTMAKTKASVARIAKALKRTPGATSVMAAKLGVSLSMRA